MSRVLLVEDDPHLLRNMRITLHASGHEVITAATGRKALSEAAAGRPDLVVLDLGLPDLDGLEVIRSLRGWTGVPIIVLSGRASGGDKVTALDAGADDYVTKPFGVDELLARIRAVTRRAIAPEDGVPAVRIGGWSVHLADRRVSSDRGEVKLTPTEWKLLEAFVRHPGKLIGQRQLLTEVWGPVGTGDTSSLRLYLNRLRRKLEPDPSRPRHLLTEPGIGYRFLP
ncbi:MAG: DNA-binding response regulator KdpE [uncultured Corynebacteriales bacterium]|uniref:DNA-binding response regulator KdpE n=1 Tax=uncultured Mycobacteriales bacterium TaxID=581187 RepID=A0A6J4HIU0_9ACTN|nr:MAG: DNA-binding response regulator KdpE [uncultured Corynebacteriales bacterium]